MREEHPKTIDCDRCFKLAYRVFFTPAIVDDFPEHYNISMDCVVKNRADHKRIQKERGLQDYEVLREGPMTEKLRKEGLL